MATAPLPTPSAAPPRIAWSRCALGLAAVGLGVALFAGTFANLLRLWDMDQSYSHGYIVPLISAWLAYRVYRRVGPPIGGDLRLSLTGMFIGVSCQLAATVLRWPPLSFLGLICVIRGLLVAAGGRKWAAEFTFPLLFLFFMFPLPVTWTSYAALLLQDIVSRISESVLSLFLVCTRVGHTIRIAGLDQSLVVAEECSGLGQIVAFVAFAALLGHLMQRPGWYRVVLILAAVPIAVFANTLRVVLMNVGAYWFGTRWMHGTLHDAPALFGVPVGVVMFLVFDHVLDRLAFGKSEPKSAPATPAAAETPPSPPPAPALGSMRPFVVASAALALGVVAQFGLTTHLRAAGELSYPTLTAPLATLPLVVNDPATGQPMWKGKDMPGAADAIRSKLPYRADDLLVRAYYNVDGVGVQLYMVHSRAGEDRKHHPEICIREVSGAPEDLSFRAQVPIRPDGSARAQRFRFRTGVGRSIVVYYWHYTPVPVPDPGRSRLQRLHLRLGVAAPSLTAQVTLGTDDPRAIAAVEKGLLPALDRAAREQVLPPGTEAACNRVPIALTRE